MQALATRLASLYEAAPTEPTYEELTALRRWISSEFWRLPCPVDFIETDLDLDQTIIVYQNTGILPISVLNNTHPYLSFADNARFRAIHDYHHIASGADSTMRGEIKAFRHACKTAPKSIYWLLFSEIVLQAAACIHSGEFQAQKTVRAGGF
jgi:hypothetical protein